MSVCPSTRQTGKQPALLARPYPTPQERSSPRPIAEDHGCVPTLTYDAVFDELILAEVDEGLDVGQALWGMEQKVQENGHGRHPMNGG